MKLSLLIVAALTSVASGVTTASFNATVVDSEGAQHTGTVSASTLTPNPDGSSTLVTTLVFADDIPVGGFTGSVQTVDSTGAALGAAVSYSGTVSAPAPSPTPVPPPANMQPVAQTVTVQVG